MDIKQLLEIADCLQGSEECGNQNDIAADMIGSKCVFRTHSAGVFFGTLGSRNGKECILKDSRRIWSWSGAFTLSAVALDGIESGKLSKVEPRKLITECIEIIPCSPEAAKIIQNMPTHE